MLYNDSLKVYIRKGGTVVVPLFLIARPANDIMILTDRR